VSAQPAPTDPPPERLAAAPGHRPAATKGEDVATPVHVIIDGNNLLYAMHAHAPIPTVGRETLVKILHRWASAGDDRVTLVFDGPTPREGLARQMASKRMTVKFSAPESADDIIVSMIERAGRTEPIRVVSSDGAIRHVARHRRCQATDTVEFIAELFPPSPRPATSPESTATSDKPQVATPEEIDEWLTLFGFRDEDNGAANGEDRATP
jgi:predicted RNA-binding protein with PIN domain